MRTGIFLSLMMYWAALAGCVGISQTSRRTDRTPEAIVLTDQGQASREAGDLNSALEYFQSALSVNPRHVPAHLGKGDVFRLLGEYEKAESSYAEARSIEPTSFEANHKLAVVQQLTLKVQNAIDNYLIALTIHPESFEANSNLAAAFSQLGRHGQARPYAERAVQLNPQSMHSMLNLASIYIAIGRDDLAIDAYRAAADIEPLSPSDTMHLAEALLREGHHERAVNVLGVLTREHQDHAGAYERMGFALFQLLRFDESLAAYEQAIALDEKNTSSLNGIGVNCMVLALRNSPPEPAMKHKALEYWRRSLRIESNQPRIIDLLARYDVP